MRAVVVSEDGRFCSHHGIDIASLGRAVRDARTKGSLNGRGGSFPLTLNPRKFRLEAGKHTLVIRGREADAQIDKLIITNDLDFKPADE